MNKCRCRSPSEKKGRGTSGADKRRTAVDAVPVCSTRLALRAWACTHVSGVTWLSVARWRVRCTQRPRDRSAPARVWRACCLNRRCERETRASTSSYYAAAGDKTATRVWIADATQAINSSAARRFFLSLQSCCCRCVVVWHRNNIIGTQFMYGSFGLVRVCVMFVTITIFWPQSQLEFSSLYLVGVVWGKVCYIV